MSNVLTWAARLALLAVFAVAAVGAIDPNHDASARVLPPDAVEHTIYAYVLTVLTTLSAPRISPWLIGGVFIAAATAFEVAQAMGFVSGTLQAKDLAANLLGVGAALLPIAIARRRR